MIALIERRDGIARINAESTDVLQVNYTDINKRVDYILDKEVKQAIQSIIDSYEQGGN